MKLATIPSCLVVISLVTYSCFADGSAVHGLSANLSQHGCSRVDAGAMTVNGVFPFMANMTEFGVLKYAFSMGSDGSFRIESDLLKNQNHSFPKKSIITGKVMYEKQPVEARWSDMNPANGISEISLGDGLSFAFSFGQKFNYAVHTNYTPHLNLTVNAMAYGDHGKDQVTLILESRDARMARYAKLAQRNQIPKSSHLVRVVHTDSLVSLLRSNHVEIETPDPLIYCLTNVVSCRCVYYDNVSFLTDFSAVLLSPVVVRLPDAFRYNGDDYGPGATLSIASQTSSSDPDAQTFLQTDIPAESRFFKVVVRYEVSLNATKTGNFLTIFRKIAFFKDEIMLPYHPSDMILETNTITQSEYNSYTIP